MFLFSSITSIEIRVPSNDKISVTSYWIPNIPLMNVNSFLNTLIEPYVQCFKPVVANNSDNFISSSKVTFTLLITKADKSISSDILTSISGIKDNQILVSQEDTFSNNQEEYILVYIFKIENLYIIINLKEIGICNYLLSICACNDDYDIDKKIMKQIKDEINK